MKFLKTVVNIFRFDRTNWTAVTLCLLAATVFWFFNALNKEHTATLAYPLQFKYDEANFIPVKQLPEKVALNLTGSGWDLFRKSLGFRVEPLVIALEKPSETKKIPPATILPMAAVLLGGNRVNHVANDTLLVQIEPRKKRLVKVALNQKRLRFELGYGLAKEVSLEPTSVLVEGAQSLVNNLADTLWLSYSTGRLSQSVKAEIDIVNTTNNRLTITPPTVTVRLDVDELKDVTRSVKVIVLPASPYRFQILTDSTRLVLRLPTKQVPAAKSSLTLFAVVDLQHVDVGVSKISPDIKGLPAFAEVLMVDSISIRKY